jgi:transcriptional regulator GlxA family with amidase domain
VVNAAEVGLSVGTEAGDRIHLHLTRQLARELGRSILGALDPRAVLTPKTRRRGHSGLPAPVVAELQRQFERWTAGEITQGQVASDMRLSTTTVQRHFARLQESPTEKAPILKPGGAIL